MIGSVIFSLCIRAFKNLHFNVKTNLFQRNCYLKIHNFLFLKGTTEFLRRNSMQAHQEGESPWISEWLILKDFYFSCTFRNTVKAIFHISSFNLTLGLWRIYRFLPLSLMLIPMHAEQ